MVLMLRIDTVLGLNYVRHEVTEGLHVDPQLEHSSSPAVKHE